MKHFSEFWEQSDKDEILEYFHQLLLNDKELQNQFIEYFNEKHETFRLQKELVYSKDDILTRIIEESDNISGHLGLLDFEEIDWESWRSPGYYVPEYEIAAEIAQEEAMDTFECYAIDMKAILTNGNFIDIIETFTAIFHGISNAEIHDPHENLSADPNEFFVDALTEIIEDNSDLISIRRYTKQDFQAGFDVLFTFNQKYYNLKTNYSKALAILIIHMIQTKEIAEMFWNEKNKYRTDFSHSPKFLNKVVSLLENPEVWLTTLEQCFLSDFETSKELLDYYYQNNCAIFEEKALSFFRKFKHNNTITYLKDKVDKQSVIYIEILKYEIESNENVTSLEVLKTLQTQEQVLSFINNIQSLDCKVKMLANEKMYDEVIELINTNCFQNHSLYSRLDFISAVHTIINVRADEAYSLIKRYIDLKLKQEKNRQTYKHIASVLSMVTKSNALKERLQIIILELMSYKPSLPALKDELRKAGLV